MDPINAHDLHGYLIDEQKSGSLTEIPATLYESAISLINSLKERLVKINDPLGEGVQSLVEERESLREYLRDLYAKRTKKIIELAQAKANGEDIDQNELRMMISGERALYRVILEACEECRKNLLEGKQTYEITAYSNKAPEVLETANASPAISENTPDFESAQDTYAPQITTDSAEQAPELYHLISVRSKIDSFQDMNGRIYTLSPGDIVSMPKQMADVLCSTNKATIIHSRK